METFSHLARDEGDNIVTSGHTRTTRVEVRSNRPKFASTWVCSCPLHTKGEVTLHRGSVIFDACNWFTSMVLPWLEAAKASICVYDAGLLPWSWIWIGIDALFGLFGYGFDLVDFRTGGGASVSSLSSHHIIVSLHFVYSRP